MDLGRHPDAWDESTLYADDLSHGDAYELGSHTVTKEELVDFASVWDPQSFHVDEAVAEKGIFGGLIAGGVHTLSVFQRLSVLGFWAQTATIAARGMRDVRFLSPVRPDATLVGRLVIEEVQPRDASRSLVSVAGTLDAEGGRVLSLVVDAYLARRHDASA
jgi:acyl dehydratase